MARRDPERALVAACGVLGPILLACYFAAPLLAPALASVVYSANPPTQQVVEVGTSFHQLLLVGTWLQANGALLSVVFFLGLVRLSGAATHLAGMVVMLGAAVLVATVLLEGVCTVTWAAAAAAGERTSARVAFDLTASFIHVFPIVPAPAVYLSLGVVLLKGRVLPRVFAPLAIALGAAFEVAGLAGAFVPPAIAAVAAFGPAQVIWSLAAAIALGTRPAVR